MEKCNPLNQKLSFERRRLWISESMEGEILVYLRISPAGGTGVRTKRCFAPGRGTFVEIQKYPKNLRGFGPGPRGEPSIRYFDTVRRGQETGHLSHPRPLPLFASEIGLCFSLLKAHLWVNNRGVPPARTASLPFCTKPLLIRGTLGRPRRAGWVRGSCRQLLPPSRRAVSLIPRKIFSILRSKRRCERSHILLATINARPPALP